MRCPHASLQPMDAPSSELAAAGAQAGPPPQGVEAFLAAAGPLIDLRSPAEFAQGHIPGTTNLPLFDNDERAEIGTLYKQQDRQAAVLHGLALVGPRMVSLGTALLAALAEHRSASSTASPSGAAATR